MDTKIKALFKIIYSEENVTAFLAIISVASFFIAALFPYSMEEEINKTALYFSMSFAGIYFSYPAEKVKFKEAGYFIRFGVRRKDYIIHAILIENLMGITFSAITAIITFILCDYTTFGYIGFIINKNFIGFMKLILVNHIYFSLFLSIGKILFVIIDRYILKWIKGFPVIIIIYIIWVIIANIRINMDILSGGPGYTILLAATVVIITNYMTYKAWLKMDIN